MNPEIRARVGVLLTVVAWGASFAAIKTALSECSPISLIWVRFAIGSVLLLSLALGKGMPLPSGREWRTFALLGFLSVPFHTLIQTTGLKTAGAATSAWIVATSPVYVAILGWLFLGERLRLGAVAGIALSALGIVLVVSHGDIGGLLSGTTFGFGDLLVFASAINWAVFSVISRHVLSDTSPLRSIAWVMTLGFLMTTAIYGISGAWGELAHLSGTVWGCLVFLGLFCTGLGYAFWYEGLRHLPAAQVGAFMYLNPLSATVVAASLLGEPLSWSLAAGGAAVMTGVWLVNRS